MKKEKERKRGERRERQEGEESNLIQSPSDCVLQHCFPLIVLRPLFSYLLDSTRLDSNSGASSPSPFPSSVQALEAGEREEKREARKGSGLAALATGQSVPWCTYTQRVIEKHSTRHEDAPLDIRIEFFLQWCVTHTMKSNEARKKRLRGKEMDDNKKRISLPLFSLLSTP